jgi:hypothetical protein
MNTTRLLGVMGTATLVLMLKDSPKPAFPDAPPEPSAHIATSTSITPLPLAKSTRHTDAFAQFIPTDEGRQFRRGRGDGFIEGQRYPPPPPPKDVFWGDTFTFCRLTFDSVRSFPLGLGWSTDHPSGDRNLMIRVGELTAIPINKDRNGDPVHVVVRATDEQLRDYPFLFASDVGTLEFSDREVEALREYLVRGGFLWVDDFWGDLAWSFWKEQIDRVLPPDEFRTMDIPKNHPIFNIVFELDGVPQVPSIQYWSDSGGLTSELGDESRQANLKGIFDRDNRLLVLMSHNTDIADGWEREGQNKAFFDAFSIRGSYPLGINVVAYIMTH